MSFNLPQILLFFQVILIDSDVILMDDIANLWKLFDEFASSAVSPRI